MINDNIKASGELEIILVDENGNVKTKTVVPNLVVTAGKYVIASRLTGASTSVMTHMAVGTGTASPIAANTTLGTEIGGSRVALATAGGIQTLNEIEYTAVFPAGVGTGAITEAGVFNDATVGSMLCRTTFQVVNKDAGDSLTINWKITIS